MKKLLIIDGNSIINRAFYAIRPLTTKDGLNTNGIYGFLNILLKTMEDEKPDYITVAYDLPDPTFRHREYKLYKAHRKGMPPELAQQMPVLKELLATMNIAGVELSGYEADDIIGTVAAMCEREGVVCRILTGDKDDLQLVTENINVLLTTTSKSGTETVLYDVGAVVERYGVEPPMLIDVKGLMGDSSDNIPGVSGVGEKTALALISKYKSLEGVYENTGDLKGALKEKIENGRDLAFLSRRLATIVCDAPIQCKIEDFATRSYGGAFIPMLEKLEFRSFLSRFEAPVQQEAATEIFETRNEISEIDGEFYYTLCGAEVLFCHESKVYRAKTQTLKSIFENEAIDKITNNAKDDIVYLAGLGIEYNGLKFDTAIAAYILDPARTDFHITSVARDFTGSSPDDAGAVSVLKDVMNSQIAKMKEFDQLSLYNDIELPLISVLAHMQLAGFKADIEMLRDFSEMLRIKEEALQAQIFELSGEVFNINSPKQLGVILFEKLGLPPVKKTKTGYSTGVDVLEKLRRKHEIIGSILQYRHITKLKSTYADGLQAVVEPKTGRIHSTFNQTVTTTGRISSTDPNLQNIPVRTELGKELRRVFTAENDDYILIDADYSQIELRVLAAVSGDEKMTDAFLRGVDIHAQTAAQVFRVPDFMVTDDMRRKAKAVNFGIVYGIGEYSLADDIGVSIKEAKEYIQRYLDSFSAVRDYMKNTVSFAKEHGYVKTLSGRRRYIPEINSGNYNVRSFGERVALNAPIQGTAADIIKIAMIRVAQELKKHAPKSRLVLQVHDELIIEAHIDEAVTAQSILKKEMENAFPLAVPLVVDVKSGRSWYDAK